jgi:hypothetical protein
LESDTPSHVINDQQADNTTKFVSESSGMTASMIKPIHMTKELLCAAKASEKDLKAFLANPVLVLNNTFHNTDTGATAPILDIDSQLTLNPIWQVKLYGFLGVRATAVIRLQVNTNRYQQGRYILAWIPSGGATSTFNGAYNLSRRIFDKCSVTQLPHVEIDLATQTECVLKVPYLTTYTHYPLNSTVASNGSRGSFVVYPYSPVELSGVVNVPYKVYMSWEDVDFAAPVVPQMADFELVPSPGQVYQSIFDNIKTKVSTAIEEERESTGAGPLTSRLRVAAKGSSWIERNVPLLSELAKPVTWALSIGSGVASFFGWSNPVDISRVHRALQTWMPFALNCDAIDESMPLSLFSQNQLELLPGLGGTDVDEMSLAHLLTIPAYWRTDTITTSTIENSLIYSCPLEPRQFQKQYTVNTSHTLFSQTPVCFFSQFCSLWRGGFRFTFKIVKTEFHSGRIGVLFQPYDYNTSSSTSTPDFDAVGHYAMRHIIDIRETNEFQLDIPYTSLRQYHRNPALISSVSTNITNGTFDPMGYLYVYVVNQINSPSGLVSSNVRIITEVSAIEGFEIAMPQDSDMTVATPGFSQMGEVEMGRATTHGTMSKNSQDKPHAATQETIGNSYITDDNLAAARLCIGERINSVLQFLKMAVPMPGSFGTGTTALIDPTAIGVAELPTSASATLDFTKSDYFALICSCFAFNRGSIRLRTILTGSYPANAQCTFSVLLNTAGRTNYKGYIIPAPTSYVGDKKEMRVVQNTNFTGGVEVTVGGYMQSFTRSSMACTFNPSGTQAVVYQDPGASAYTVVVGNDNGASQAMRLMRQVGDDFQLGLFCGVPQLYY